MHTEEIKTIILNKFPWLQNSSAKGVMKAFYDLTDNIRFRIFSLSNKHCDNEIGDETTRLLYSWQTFSKDYLKFRHGQDYNHPSRVRMKEIVSSLIDGYNGENKLRLLEIPFGMGGDYEHYFSKMNLNYTGMELNPKQVEMTRERLPCGNFKTGNILKLQEPDGYFDIVYCRHIFEHLSLSAMNVALSETIRVAKRDLVYIFFKMADIDDHKEIKVRKYHLNLLSQERLKDYIQSFECVENIEVISIPKSKNSKENTIFHVHLKG